MRAYGVLLRVEIARFTPDPASCDTASGLVSVALILTSRWTAVGCYAALCSPDLPPARPFGPRAGGGLACFTGRLWSRRAASAQQIKRPERASTSWIRISSTEATIPRF